MMTQNAPGRRYSLAVGGRYLLMILLGVIFFFPILFMVISSLKPTLQIL